MTQEDKTGERGQKLQPLRQCHKPHKAEGRAIDGVEIPAPLNKQGKVSYAIGALNEGRNPYNAYRFLSYLGTDRAQSIYASYGFIPATTEELKLKPLERN